MKRILLIGNPNVGKSVFFSRLTGTHVISSNYPGTTVEVTRGETLLNGETYEVIDVPGTYSLSATCKAEDVACRLLEESIKDRDTVINIIDSTNLERNLSLTLELMEKDIKVIVALNMWDDTRHRGITIDIKKLEEWLGVPVVATTAVTGEGFKELAEKISSAANPKVREHDLEDRWKDIGEIISKIQKLEHRHHTFAEFVQDMTIHPLSGLIIAAFVAGISFMLIRLIGESIIGYVADPFFEQLYKPLLMQLSNILGGQGLFHDVLVGRLINSGIDFKQSFGVLSTALYVEFAMVAPYLMAFYLVLGVLEDSGYLPRLAVLMDNFMHRLGLHGFAIVPVLLGFGCNVPGILATRVLESKRERFIAATLISIGIPCAALQAMIIGILGQYGVWPVFSVYFILFLVWIVLGTILNRLMKGFSPELLIEIPPYRFPPARVLFTKTWVRIKYFLKEALPVVIIGVFIIDLLYIFNFFNSIASAAAPVVTGLFGLPKEAISAIAVGFLRKDIAAGLLIPLNLSIKQLIVASVVLSMSFPCVATFAILFKELGAKDGIKSTMIMIASSLIVGTLLNFIL